MPTRMSRKDAKKVPHSSRSPIVKQKREMKYSVNGRVWISAKGETFLGYGRVVLLERIREYGSITRAAKSMGMSYRNAWELVASMNNISRQPMVVPLAGGKGGGGTTLTKHGEKAIAIFWKLRSDVMKFFEKKNRELAKLYDE